jgi:D-inositol-3-phosphate glycosyltransferase
MRKRRDYTIANLGSERIGIIEGLIWCSDMRIAMLSYHTCPLAVLGGKDTGGMNVYVREITRVLGEMGVHVDVFTRSQNEHVPHVLHDLGYGNRIVHIPAGPEYPLPKTELAAHLPQFEDGINEFAHSKGISYDLIHSHYWMSGMAAIQLKKGWGVPIVNMFHTLGLMKNRVAQSPNEIEGEYRIDGERQVMRAADKIIAATQAEYAQLLWLYQVDENKIIVIPPGVDLRRFYPIPADEAKEYIGIPPCGRMLLFVGRIEPLKGLDVLIEAICLMRQNEVFKENPFCLAVIGGEPAENSEVDDNLEMSRLKELTERAGLGDLVTFLGKKSQDSLPYYYSAAEAVVVPSQYESFGMVALEAMACGTPVVASQIGGLAYLVQDGVTGYTVPVDEPGELARRLTSLLVDHDLRHRLGKQAIELAQGYAWDKIATRLLSVYQGLVASPVPQ